MTLNVEFSESQINKIMHFRLVIRNRQSDDMTIIGKSKMHNQKRLFPPKKSRLKSTISFFSGLEVAALKVAIE